MSLILGVDTSNYTTSVALVDEDGKVVLNSKEHLPVAEGERGLRQSDSLFSHVKNLPAAMYHIRGAHISAVGVSTRPRDVAGSYMPCFLAGMSAAASVASVLDVPLMEFSHQRGHVRAALYSAGREDLVNGRFVSFHVSGGTTEILLLDNGKIDLIGSTLDLNAGQAIDRVGVMLGLGFPAGAALSELAEGAEVSKKPKICVNGLDCNFSGLENKAHDLFDAGVSPECIAAYTLEYVKLTLHKLAENVRARYPDVDMIFGGGVCSNRDIAQTLQRDFGAYFAAPEFSSDNAAGIALLAYDEFVKETPDAG